MHFLSDMNFESSKYLCNEKLLLNLAYLADIFAKINRLDLSLKRLTTIILSAHDKIYAFTCKLGLWADTDHHYLETFQSFVTETSITQTHNMTYILCCHLKI
jgi:hypothetical protein